MAEASYHRPRGGGWEPPTGTLLWLSSAKSGSVAKLGTWADQIGSNDTTLYADAEVGADGLVLDGNDYGLSSTLGTWFKDVTTNGQGGSVSFMIETTSQENKMAMGFSFVDSTPATNIFFIGLNRDYQGNDDPGVVNFAIRTYGSSYRIWGMFDCGSELYDGNRHNITISWTADASASVIHPWFDATEKSVTYLDRSNVEAKSGSNQQLCIGGYNSTGTPSFLMTGTLDGILIADEIWGQDEVDDITTNSPDNRS